MPLGYIISTDPLPFIKPSSSVVLIPNFSKNSFLFKPSIFSWTFNPAVLPVSLVEALAPSVTFLDVGL